MHQRSGTTPSVSQKHERQRRVGSAVRCRGIRGATTVENDDRAAVIEATIELLRAMIETNAIDKDEVASAFFTTTPDITAEFPALAARQIGWTNVAMLCGHEMAVPGSLPRCLRILLHVNTDKNAADVVHVYLRGAKVLRPDLVRDEDRQRDPSIP